MVPQDEILALSFRFSSKSILSLPMYNSNGYSIRTSDYVVTSQLSEVRNCLSFLISRPNTPNHQKFFKGTNLPCNPRSLRIRWTPFQRSSF
jgi:hypothetical protein